MSKYNKSEIMRDAWRLYRTLHAHDESYTFSDALTSAWRNAKAAIAKAEEEAAQAANDVVINGWDVTKLEKAGAKRWTKYGKDRLYLRGVGNELLGIKLFYNYRHNPSWSNATINGEDISNGWACTIMDTYSDAYIDLTTGEICNCGTRAGMEDEFKSKMTERFAA